MTSSNSGNIYVTGGTNAGAVRTANNQAEYWSEKSKQWAVGEGVIEGSNHSSKHYAESVSSTAADAVSNINSTKDEATAQITSATNSAISQINEAKRQVLFGLTEIPVTYGIYTDMPMDMDKWLYANSDDTEFLAEDYPEFWSLLQETLDGETDYDIDVCTTSDAADMVSGLSGVDLIMANNKLAYYFIVDNTNNTFKIPKCVRDERCIGKSDIAAIAGQSNHGGVYTTSMRGKYFECSAIVRLEKATKTVSGETVTYHKATQYNNTTTYLTPTEQTINGKTMYGLTLTATLAQELMNSYYHANIYIGKNVGGEGELDLKICGVAHGVGTINSTTTQTTFAVPMYDGERTDTDGCAANIPDGETESYLMYTIEGYAEIPDIADYNLNSKLWIKVV